MNERKRERERNKQAQLGKSRYATSESERDNE